MATNLEYGAFQSQKCGVKHWGPQVSKLERECFCEMKLKGNWAKLWIPVASLVLAIGAVAGFTNLWVSKAAVEAPSVGYLNLDKVLAGYSRFQEARAALQKEFDRLQKELNTKAEGLDAEGKKKMLDDYQSKLDKRKLEILGPIEEEVDKAIAEVAKAQNVNVVLNKNINLVVDNRSAITSPIVLYGGKDLTDEVLKKLNGSSKPGNDGSKAQKK